MKYLLGLLLVANVLIAQPKFSNFIFFGDSLVDVGNFPSSAELMDDPNKLVKNITADDYAATFYVPVSNPVNTQGRFFKIYQYDKAASHSFAWPSVIPASARQSMPSIGGKARGARSMLWPEFLLAGAYNDKLVNSHTLLPRLSLSLGYKNKIGIHDSINYAWISSLSGSTCANENFVTFTGSCDYKSSLQTVKKYITVRTNNIKDQVRIPGLNAQVTWFAHDLQDKTVFVDKKSAVFILVGGNDMNKSFTALQKDKFAGKLAGVGALLAGNAHYAYAAMRKLALIPGHKIQHVYLLTLFNPRWTPRISHWPKTLQHLATVFVNLYNAGLRVSAWRINHKYPWVKVKVIPMRDWFDNWAQSKGTFKAAFPKKNFGIACQADNAGYNHALTPKDNCLGYLFWNAVHPTLQAEQLMAYKILQYL